MLERKIIKKFLLWKEYNKENPNDKQCLLVKGARQVGKTFIIDQFCKENYKSYIYINFELMPEYKEIFDGNLDINTLINKLSLAFSNITIVPNDTIIFLDEIQSCPNARVALKSFAMCEYLDVICSGSLLGLYYKEITSYPVGYEETLEMYPLDFEEFLWALGVKKDLIDNLRNSFNYITKIDEFILNKISEYFRLFMIVGGMPRVVKRYIKDNNLIRVLKTQKDIINNYLLDINKYAPSKEKQKIKKSFDSIPVQLAKKNKKFNYNDILDDEKNVGEREYASSLDWLKDAGIINYCYNLTEPAAPLLSNIKINCFKIYMRDTGLLLSKMENGVGSSIMNKDLYINEGAIVENICAEEIITRYENVMYFEKKSKLEIDFVLNIDGVVTAVEVKSGNNKQSKSLKSIIENYPTVSRYIKFEKDTNIYKDENGIEHYPLFMIMFL